MAIIQPEKKDDFGKTFSPHFDWTRNYGICQKMEWAICGRQNLPKDMMERGRFTCALETINNMGTRIPHVFFVVYRHNEELYGTGSTIPLAVHVDKLYFDQQVEKYLSWWKETLIQNEKGPKTSLF